MTSNEAPLGSIAQPLILEEPGFDYTILSSDSRTVVQQYADEIKSLMRRSAHDVINIGQKLLEVKEQLGHGYFEAWLRAEFNWGQWTARKFMQVTRQFKTVNFTDLSINASALYLLAAPSTPEAVRQEALERAGQGEVMTRAKVKAIASRHGEAIKSEADKAVQLFTIDISAEAVEGDIRNTCGPGATSATVAENQVVAAAEEQLGENSSDTSEVFQVQHRSDDRVVATGNSVAPVTAEAEVELQSLLGAGNLICLMDFRQQDHRWLGKVAAVKEATATEIEVVVKISLPLISKSVKESNDTEKSR